MPTFNNDPVFGKAQRSAVAKVSTATAVTAADLDVTPTNAVKIPLNGVNGSFPLGAPVGGCVMTNLHAHLVDVSLVAAAVLKLYLSKDNGVTMYCIKDITHAAITMTNVLAAPDDDFGFTESSPLRLEENDQIYIQARAASAVTDAFHVTGQYTELQV